MNENTPNDLERLLHGVPERVPPPEPETTSRVAARILGACQRRPQSAGRILLLAAVFLVVAGTGFTAGRWTGPTRAASDVTIGARPDTVYLEQMKRPFTLFGTVASGRPDESVEIEANECGLSGLFHELRGVRTEGQGVWSLPIPGNNPEKGGILAYIETTTKYRARWNGHLSETVTVHVRSYVEFRQFMLKKKTAKHIFGVNIGGRQMKYRPRITIERRARDSWKRFATRVVDRGFTEVRLRVAKGQVLRVRLPDAQAGPCYLGSVSPPVRVR